MRRITLVLAAVALLCTGGCLRAEAPAPVTELEARVEPAPGSYLQNMHGTVSGVALLDVTVTRVVCDPDWHDVDAGDPCLVVSGHIRNEDSEKTLVSMFARGYDAAGEQVAWTLDSRGRIPGLVELHVDYGETREFVIHLNAPDGVQTIRVYSTSYEGLEPVSTPAAPLPESGMTRISFSRQWLLENDVEPDEDTVTITFLRLWMRHPPDMLADEETVELVIPTRFLMDQNTNEHPAMLTVTLPRRCFEGL